MLETVSHHTLVISLERGSKRGHVLLHLQIFAHSRFDRVHFVLIVDEARVVLLLWQLCEVAALAVAHSDLSVGAL